MVVNIYSQHNYLGIYYVIAEEKTHDSQMLYSKYDDTQSV